MVSTKSMSWIIKSKTTLTSVPRRGNPGRGGSHWQGNPGRGGNHWQGNPGRGGGNWGRGGGFRGGREGGVRRP